MPLSNDETYEKNHFIQIFFLFFVPFVCFVGKNLKIFDDFKVVKTYAAQ